jgi:hypothetical protein
MNRFLLTVFLAVSVSASAQKAFPEAKERPAPPRVTSLEFGEGDLIEGATQAPEVEVVSSVASSSEGSLIRVRESFRAEVLASDTEMP